jgi:hypothetical protein
MNKNDVEKTCTASWSGSGDDLFDTIQIIKDKEFHDGYFETDVVFKFSDKFKYPLVLELKSSDSAVELTAIAFDISNIGKREQMIEQNIIVPKVCKIIVRDNFIDYFASIIEENGNFSIYIDNKPAKFEKLRFHSLTDAQKIVFNEHLVMAIAQLLDRKKGNKH